MQPRQGGPYCVTLQRTLRSWHALQAKVARFRDLLFSLVLSGSASRGGGFCSFVMRGAIGGKVVGRARGVGVGLGCIVLCAGCFCFSHIGLGGIASI